MSIEDRAARAANAERERRAEEAAAEGDIKTVPVGEDWDRYEEQTSVLLKAITGEDPGPAQRLEPHSWRMRQMGAQYPDAVQRRRLLVYMLDGITEVVAARGSKRGDGSRPVDLFVVHRSANPNEEAVLSNFRDLPSLGRAMGA